MAAPDRPGHVPLTAGGNWIRSAGVAINWLLSRTGDFVTAAQLAVTDAALAALTTLVARKTGWGNYPDSAGAQAIAAATRTQVTIDGVGKIESQKPSDVTAFWDANAITGRNGDAIVVKVQCVFTPSDALASTADFEVDIGGAVGVVERQSFPVTGGALTPHYFEWTFLAYTLGTWATNGGKIYITTDGPANLTSKRVVVSRAHKAF